MDLSSISTSELARTASPWCATTSARSPSAPAAESGRSTDEELQCRPSWRGRPMNWTPWRPNRTAPQSLAVTTSFGTSTTANGAAAKSGANFISRRNAGKRPVSERLSQKFSAGIHHPSPREEIRCCFSCCDVGPIAAIRRQLPARRPSRNWQTQIVRARIAPEANPDHPRSP